MNNGTIAERAAEFINGGKDITTSGERQDERAMKLLGSLACDFDLESSVKTLRERMADVYGGKKSVAYKRENSRVSLCVTSIEYFADEVIDNDMTLAQLWADEVYPFGSLRETYELAKGEGKPKLTNAEKLLKLMQKMPLSEVTEVYRAHVDSIAAANIAVESKVAEKHEKIQKFRKVTTTV